MVVVAIIGVLAAVAIPAYNSYQANAKASTIRGSLNQIAKAFNACITVNNRTTCTSTTINGTIAGQANAAITATLGTGTPAGACFVVTGSGTLANYTGCIALNENGELIRQSADSDISDTTSTATCAASNTVCAN